jgi:DnaJ-class molecular chaperone
MANFREIDEARRTLGLSEAAILKEIKQAYRNTASRCHPDRAWNDAGSGERMKKLNRDYQILMHSCARFH